MFNKAYIKHLEEEVAYLRKLVNEKNYITDTPVDPIRTVDLETGEVLKMEAPTEQEQQERQDAINEIYELDATAGAY